jgi:hypothetical protein
MFIQGNLQVLFDALFEIGAIEPVLKMDWKEVTEEMQKHPEVLQAAIASVNSCQGQRDSLVQKLKGMDSRYIHYIALEVAREFAEFQDRKNMH